jgi:hypothetical protein
MIATGTADAAKIAMSPATENHAATAAMVRATMNTKSGKNILLSLMIVTVLFICIYHFRE